MTSSRYFVLMILLVAIDYNVGAVDAPGGKHPASAASEPVALGSDCWLFVDDHFVAHADGLKRTLHQPLDYKQNPVLLPERPWEHRRIPFGSVYYIPEERKFKCWYLAMNIYDSRPGFRGYSAASDRTVPLHESAFICYAESLDGIHWDKPHLGVHDYRGSTANNIVLTHRGSHFDSPSVVYTPASRETPYRIMVFQGRWPYEEDRIRAQWGNDFRFGIQQHGHYAWSSRDGVNFEPLLHDDPVLVCGDRTMTWYDPVREVFVASAKSPHNGVRGRRAQRYAESNDFVHWNVTDDWMMAPDERDDPRDQSESCYGFRYGAQYVGYVEMRRMRGPNQSFEGIDWELMISYDGRNWSRPIRELFLPTGPKDGWRFESVKIFANPPILQDQELRIYYSGKTGMNDAYSGTGPNQAVSFARLRKDGFVSLDAGPQGGALTTRPLLLEGDALHLNADASAGEVRVEARTLAGKPIAGFSADQCVPITGDALSATVRWTNARSLERLRGTPVQLVIHMKDARLYSIWTE